MTYIHPDDRKIAAFIQNNICDKSSIRHICDGLLNWFDENVAYSRLNAPFFPLQRSDLDVLEMKSGTCGDYANLVVSVMLNLGHEAAYAYVHKDCYGDAQDHICAAVRDGEAWILIDATQPYRKWHGFDCPHKEYELLLPAAFEAKMKEEERYWTDKAHQFGDLQLAGLLYAPWIHEEVIAQSENALESVFFLLLLDAAKNMTLYAYYQRYSKESGAIPVMGFDSDGVRKYRFACKTPDGIWDDGQWGEEYAECDVPGEFQTKEFFALKDCIAKISAEIGRIRQKSAEN